MENSVTLIGNLGRDPELNHTKSGMAVCNLSLATSDRIKSGDEWIDKTEWHNVTVWGKTAENVAKYLSKGSMAFVRGRLQTDSFEKDGVKHYRTKVVAERVKFLGGKGASSAGSSPQSYTKTGAGYAGAPAPYDSSSFGPPPGDDDIPF